jgi:hypothetical protein
MNVLGFFKRLPRRQFNKIIAVGAGRIALIGTLLGLMLNKAWAEICCSLPGSVSQQGFRRAYLRLLMLR